MKLKTVSFAKFPNGEIKKVKDLTPEEKKRLIRSINSAPARALGYEYEWVS